MLEVSALSRLLKEAFSHPSDQPVICRLGWDNFSFMILVEFLIWGLVRWPTELFIWAVVPLFFHFYQVPGFVFLCCGDFSRGKVEAE